MEGGEYRCLLPLPPVLAPRRYPLMSLPSLIAAFLPLAPPAIWPLAVSGCWLSDRLRRLRLLPGCCRFSLLGSVSCRVVSCRVGRWDRRTPAGARVTPASLTAARPAPQSSGRAAAAESDRREKRALERKLSEMEEELKVTPAAVRATLCPPVCPRACASACRRAAGAERAQSERVLTPHRRPARRPCQHCLHVSAIAKTESREREIEGRESRADSRRLEAY